jgi:hypothetical protein
VEQQEGQALRTNIKRITRYFTDKITGWGFDVYITMSRSSKSRYLEFNVGRRRGFIIRISDHPTCRYWKYDYDVYTNRPRRAAVNYVELIKLLEQRLFMGRVIKGDKTG